MKGSLLFGFEAVREAFNVVVFGGLGAGEQHVAGQRPQHLADEPQLTQLTRPCNEPT